MSPLYFHCFFLHHSPVLLCIHPPQRNRAQRKQGAPTEKTRSTHRENNEEECSDCFSRGLDCTRDTHQGLKGSSRTDPCSPDHQSCSRSLILPRAPGSSPPGAPNPPRPRPVHSSAGHMAPHLQLTLRSHRKPRAGGFSSHSGHVGSRCPAPSPLRELSNRPDESYHPSRVLSPSHPQPSTLSSSAGKRLPRSTARGL